MGKKITTDSFKDQIFLFSDIGNPETIRLRQVVKPYKHSAATMSKNIDMMIDFIAKHMSDGTDMLYTNGQYISYRLSPNDKEVRGMPLGMFLFNYILWHPNIIINGEITEDQVFDSSKLTDDSFATYINEKIAVYNRSKVDFYQFCGYIQFIKTKFNRIAMILGEKHMMSVSLHEFVSLMRDDEARESLTCSFHIPKNTSPAKLEEIVNDRAHRLLKIIEERTDLNISTYAKNGLFNPGQFKEFGVHISHKPDLTGATIPFTSNTNVLMGINDAKAHIVDARGGRKAEILKLAVSDAGEFERTLNALLADLRYVDNDYVCESEYFVEKTLETREHLAHNDGRMFTLDPESDEYYILDPRDEEVVKLAMGKRLYMKTPITCTHPKKHEGYICKGCYGYLLSSINEDIHIGRLSALQSSDQMQQKLLSAKHALNTRTDEIYLSDSFYTYLRFDGTYISFNDDVAYDMVNSYTSYNNIFIEININNVVKRRDGEGAHFDRSIKEIVIYDAVKNIRTIIDEAGGTDFYMTPDTSAIYKDFLDAGMIHDGMFVRIPFNELAVKEGEGFTIFEVEYTNNELIGPLHKLKKTLEKAPEIGKYSDYSDLLAAIIPLFHKGGIRIPDIHIEMIVSRLVFDVETGKLVDWNTENVNYAFRTLDKAILSGESIISSLLYKDIPRQIAGSYGAYEKTGTSISDIFISER